MEIPKHIPEGHALLCGCMHIQDDHQGADAEEKGTGPCTKCDCQGFHFEGKAQLRVENPSYVEPGKQQTARPRTQVPLLHDAAPPAPRSWWQRSLLRKWLRDLVGVTEDMEHGTQYMKLATSNIIHQAQLLQGLRADIDAANLTQNPVNEVVVEIERRLHFYESEEGTRLHESFLKLMRIDEKQRETERKMAAAAELDAANRRIAERKLKLETGEFLDCPKCGGSGDGEKANEVCTQCLGGGVIENPEYVPPSDYTEEGVKKHLTLED